jgi:hypothetical protein
MWRASRLWCWRRGSPARAAQLSGWADAMREVISDSRPRVEQQALDQAVAAVHPHLDSATLAAATAEVRAMTVEQAMAYALE